MIMDKLWIISLILTTAHKTTNGQSNADVELITKNYVERESSVTLFCRHNFPLESIYKVAWLRSSEHKFFEFIHRRNPPFRNFSTPGAEIDFSRSNRSQVTLKNLDFDASAAYFCEVTIDNPIFTKASKEQHIHVIVKQTGPPKIMFKKRLFVVGEKLIANCTTSRAKPAPHITWLINGEKVDDIFTKILHPKEYAWSSKHNRSKSHQQQSTTPHRNDIYYGLPVTNTAQEPRDYESPVINETDYHPHHNHQPPPFARNGYNFGHRPLSRANKINRLYHTDFGIEVRHRGDPASGGTGSYFGYDNEQAEQQIPQQSSDYGDDNRETSVNFNFYDNKYYDNLKLHRNSLNTIHKIRRHLNEQSRANSKTASGIKAVMNRATWSSSQLSIEVSELHADANGRLEISCASTIPAKLLQKGDEFADFKIYSVKIDIKTTEPTTTRPPPTSMSVIGSSNNGDSIYFIRWLYILNLVMCLIVPQYLLPFFTSTSKIFLLM